MASAAERAGHMDDEYEHCERQRGAEREERDVDALGVLNTTMIGAATKTITMAS
jgi:hypothetical protein